MYRAERDQIIHPPVESVPLLTSFGPPLVLGLGRSRKKGFIILVFRMAKLCHQIYFDEIIEYFVIPALKTSYNRTFK